jgi:RNA polymerase sigma-70 factor (ECF subfamily)
MNLHRPALRFAGLTVKILLLMPSPEEIFIRTRATLIHRLKDWKDDASWRDFFETYWKLIYKAAMEFGLNEEEAEDIVQDTMLAVAKQMPAFKYDPAIGSFKNWLLNLVKWRAMDFTRRRDRNQAEVLPPPSIDYAAHPAINITDQRLPNLDAWWEQEWQQAMLEAALRRVKRRADPDKYQVFDFLVNKSWPPEKIAATFNLPVEQIYVIRHRMTLLIKEEVAQMNNEMG